MHRGSNEYVKTISALLPQTPLPLSVSRWYKWTETTPLGLVYELWFFSICKDIWNINASIHEAEVHIQRFFYYLIYATFYAYATHATDTKILLSFEEHFPLRINYNLLPKQRGTVSACFTDAIHTFGSSDKGEHTSTFCILRHGWDKNKYDNSQNGDTWW